MFLSLRDRFVFIELDLVLHIARTQFFYPNLESRRVVVLCGQHIPSIVYKPRAANFVLCGKCGLIFVPVM